jgi:isocitrate dehydrogenase (NAD+)
MRQATLIPGDGIGPSIIESARKVIDATGVEIEWVDALAGECAAVEFGEPLPKETVESIARTGLALKGPCATPVGKGYRSINVTLRQEFDLYANVRPARSFPGVPCRYPDLDLVIIRENTEGLYTHMEHWIGADRSAAMGIGINTRAGMERICRYAFDYCRAHDRKKITLVHKANVLKILTGIFLEAGRETATRYPDIAYEDKIVDNTAMQLVLNPYPFDVIVTTNLFGDILSDEAAGLIGGLGMAPGANIGERAAIFEAVHGTAPDIAGKDIANPSSVILAGAMLLRHIGESAAADHVEAALKAVIREGRRVTRDINPQRPVGTRAMTDAILEQLEKVQALP